MTETFRPGPTQFSVGDLVIATKDLRQDGTFPDPAIAVGEVLVPADVPGQVVDVGVYLNEHIVYAVSFGNGRLVGCLEREVAPLPVVEDEVPPAPGSAPVGGEGP
jgi:hypothetical protein